MLEIGMEKVLETLQEWGYLDEGDFEELVVCLAKENGFDYVFATVQLGQGGSLIIRFEYKLNEYGKEIAAEFAAEYGTHISDEGYFYDDSPGSVTNTLRDWGVTEEECYSSFRE